MTAWSEAHGSDPRRLAIGWHPEFGAQVRWLRDRRRRPTLAAFVVGVGLLAVGFTCTTHFPFWAAGYGAVPVFAVIVIGGRLTAWATYLLLNQDSTRREPGNF